MAIGDHASIDTSINMSFPQKVLRDFFLFIMSAVANEKHILIDDIEIR